MKTLKSQKPSSYRFILLTIAMLFAMPPLTATAANTTVQAQIGQFALQDVTVNTGDTVTWVAQSVSAGIHTVTGDPTGTANGAPGANAVCQDSMNGYLYNNGDTYSHQFNTPGLCSYVCLVHVDTSDMRGTVTVNGVITTTTTTTRPTTTSTTTTTSPTTTTTTTTTLPATTTTTTTTLPNQAPSAVSLTPVNITTAPSVAQSFTAVYSDPNGYQNIADMSLLLSGTTHNELVHFSPTTNKFTMMGVGGDCSPGQATTLSSGFLTLNCGTSSVSGSGAMWTVTYNLTPLPPLSGTAYVLIIAVTDQGSLSNNKTTGTWTVNRPPSADSVSPMNSSTPPGTVQIFTAGYSDPDGWQNIAAANFYLSGNGGAHIEWLHYLVAPNLFTMLGTNDVCSPGQAITLSNGFLSLDCGASSISGSGTVLTVTFRVTPQAPSSGIQYLIFTAASDQAGAANAIFAGNWGIQ